MTITNGQLISAYDGHVCKSVNEYLAEGQKARDKAANETAGRPKPKIEPAKPMTWAEAQKAMADDKAGRIQQSIDQHNRDKAAEAELCQSVAQNPAAFIAANGGFGALGKTALNKVQSIAQTTAEENQRKAEQAAKLAEVRNDEWAALVAESDAACKTLHPTLQTEAAELSGFIRNATDPADVAAYKTRAHDLLGRQLAILDSVAAAKLAAHKSASQEYADAAAAAQAAAQTAEPEGGQE